MSGKVLFPGHPVQIWWLDEAEDAWAEKSSPVNHACLTSSLHPFRSERQSSEPCQFEQLKMP